MWLFQIHGIRARPTGRRFKPTQDQGISKEELCLKIPQIFIELVGFETPGLKHPPSPLNTPDMRIFVHLVKMNEEMEYMKYADPKTLSITHFHCLEEAKESSFHKHFSEDNHGATLLTVEADGTEVWKENDFWNRGNYINILHSSSDTPHMLCYVKVEEMKIVDIARYDDTNTEIILDD
jgi:hypothetical protein